MAPMSPSQAYNVLGLTPGASHDQIKGAYRSGLIGLNRQVNGDNSNVDYTIGASRLNEAFSVLNPKPKQEFYTASGTAANDNHTKAKATGTNISTFVDATAGWQRSGSQRRAGAGSGFYSGASGFGYAGRQGARNNSHSFGYGRQSNDFGMGQGFTFSNSGLENAIFGMASKAASGKQDKGAYSVLIAELVAPGVVMYHALSFYTAQDNKSKSVPMMGYQALVVDYALGMMAATKAIEVNIPSMVAGNENAKPATAGMKKAA